MAIIDLDLGGVASAGKPLPEGEYLFMFEECTTGLAKDEQSTNIKMKMTVVEPAEHNGRRHTENLNYQESTKPFVKAFVCALEGVEDDEIGNYKLDPEALAGCHIIGVIKHVQDGNDNTFGNVIAWKHAG